MNQSTLLTIDGIINLVLGLLLLLFPAPLVKASGMPAAPGFYPNILGGVLNGIAIALFLERGNTGSRSSGLGLNGAIAINLCGGLVLTAWLLFGALAIPLRGYLLLWGLVILLVGISLAECLPGSETVMPADCRFPERASPSVCSRDVCKHISNRRCRRQDSTRPH